MKNHLKILLSALLTLTLLGCENDDDQLVNLDGMGAPTNLGATFEITQDNSGLVSIIPTGEGATSFSIDFGDGSPTSEQVKVGEQVEHIYAEGEYEVEITGYGLNGAEGTGIQSLLVSFLAPENLETFITRNPDDNFSISVTATADNAAMFHVYFGDTEDEAPTLMMIGESVDHTYPAVGTYNLRVVALSGGEATSEVSQEIVITNPLFLPIDFESETLNYTFFNFGGGDADGVPIVENPDPSGTNTSEMVASYTKVAGSETWAGTNIPLDEPIDFSTQRYLSLDVYSPIAGAEVVFKVENLEDANVAAEATATTTVSGQWETLIFDMNSIDPAVDYGRVVLFFNMNIPGSGETYFFDNIKTTKLEFVTIPLNFESEGLSFEWTGFGGASGGVIDNPYPTGQNTSEKVVELAKNEGAETWAGISLALDETVDFSAGTTAKMKVWSPKAGATILLKLEDSNSPPNAENNPSVFIEVPQATTVAEQWEELSFDLSSAVGFDMAADYDTVILFYDFNNRGEGSTSYFDDIRITSAEEPTSVVLPVSFENPDLDYVIEGFEGAVSTMEDNPFREGINTSSKVIATTKTVGALFYAGTTLVLESPIDFTNQKKISVKSFSPKAGIPVRMKLEHINDGGIFLEVDTQTTVANEWELLEFDFSELDTSQEYSKVIIFYEFVADLPGDGTTYYFDDIQLTN